MSDLDFFQYAIKSNEYHRFCIETKNAGTVEIGNLTFLDAVKEAKEGVKKGRYYNFDFFSWDGEEFDYKIDYYAK